LGIRYCNSLFPTDEFPVSAKQFPCIFPVLREFGGPWDGLNDSEPTFEGEAGGTSLCPRYDAG